MTSEQRPAPPRSTAALLREQAGWCEALGSPLYGSLLANSADDLESGGPVADVLAGHEADPARSALALRLMGAVHRLVLERRAESLLPYYPSMGGDAAAAGAWEAFREVVRRNTPELRQLVEQPVQTNEVGRCAALVGGFVTVARETGLPLRLLEIGTSAGLNLAWDRYRYQARQSSFGDPTSPVRIDGIFKDVEPSLAVPVTVASRRGCDLAPLDARRAEDRLTLQSYVWPDQLDRLRLLRGALEVAQREQIEIDRAHAIPWLSSALASPSAGAATVVFHSVMIIYLERDERARVREVLADAGARATAQAPLAWLRLEPPGKQLEFELRLTSWPSGEERLLAVAGPHGRPVEWRA